MNYAYQYFRIISNRVQNPLEKNGDGSVETHHIIPKSEGGSNKKDNLVNLTASEHYIAHLLLAKIYNDKKMWCALNRLVHGNDFKKYNHVSSRMYQTLKENFQKHNKGNKNNLGKHLSEETKEKIRQTKIGSRNPMFGKKLSEASQRKRIEKLKGHRGYWTGKKQPKDAVERRAQNNRGKHWFNNGIVNTKAKECPEGFVAGRLRKKWSK